MLFVSRPRIFAEPKSQFGLLDQLGDRLSKFAGRLRPDKQRVITIDQKLGRAANRCADNRFSQTHGLKHGHGWHCFVARWKNNDTNGGERLERFLMRERPGNGEIPAARSDGSYCVAEFGIHYSSRYLKDRAVLQSRGKESERLHKNILAFARLDRAEKQKAQ